MNPKKEEYQDAKHELEALIKTKNTHSSQPIYDHIKYLESKHRLELPPWGYGVHSVTITSPIIRLYDYIGDIDGGIAFVDKIINYKGLYPKTRAEYLKIKEAFEEDKKQGTKGHATQVLDQTIGWF